MLTHVIAKIGMSHGHCVIACLCCSLFVLLVLMAEAATSHWCVY